MRENNKVIMGQLARPYGVHGWIKVVSFTDPIENLLLYKSWQIQHRGNWQLMTVQSGKLHGQFLVVKLEGLDNPEAAKHYTNDRIAVEREALAPLKKGDYYWCDLIGLRVVTTDHLELGTVTSLLATGSNDVLVVKDKDRERLIPYLSSVVRSVNLEEKIILVEWEADF